MLYSFRTYLAIYFVSAATLTYEIGLSRLFSIAQGYHFAFMVISIALMGIGGGGALLMLNRPLFFYDDNPKSLAALAALFSMLSVFSFISANLILFDPVKAAWSRFEFLKIFLQYLLLSLPFVLTGMIMAAAIRVMSGKVFRIYLADMTGAGTGCVLILYILARSDGEDAVLAAAILSLGASVLFHRPGILGKKTTAFLQLSALLVLTVVTAMKTDYLKVKMSPYRELSMALNYPSAIELERVPTPSGVIDVIDSPAVRAAPGISLSYMKPLPRQIGFTVNGGGLSTVTDRNGDLSFLLYMPSSVAYYLKPRARVFVIDPGGGMELLAASEKGASAVAGSESLGAVHRIMKKELGAFSGGLYYEFDIQWGLGRQVLRNLGEKFDIIQLPVTETFGSSSTGVRGLNEDFNLTVEAFVEYLEYLDEGGFIGLSLFLLPPPRQELKALSTLAAALEAAGISDASSSILAIRSWGVLTILGKKGVLSKKEIESAKEFCRKRNFDMVWYPRMPRSAANRYNRFETPLYFDTFNKLLSRTERDRFLNEYLFNVYPSTDDAPFWGYTFKMSRMKETYESVGKKWGILIEGGYMLPWVLLQAALASALLILTPLLLMKREKAPRGLLAPTILYFASIGMGFMFLEITLLHKLIPVLGEPVYSISVALFTVLISTGIGSYLSGRLNLAEKHSAHIILLLPAMIFIYFFIFDPIAGFVSGFSLTAKYILTFIIFFPLCVLMGIPFPSGMYLLGKETKGLIPWAWCINGTLSVISSVLCMIIALSYGFAATFTLAGILYVFAWPFYLRIRKECA